MAQVFHGCKGCASKGLSSVLFVVGMTGWRLLTAHLTIGGSVTPALKQRHLIAGVADMKLLLNPGNGCVYSLRWQGVLQFGVFKGRLGICLVRECFSWHKAEDMVEVNRGRRNALICKSCYTEHYQQCPTCGQKIHKSDVYPVTLVGGEGEVIMCAECLSGYFYCELCDRWERRADKFILTDGRSICHECAEGLPKCTVCNGLVLGGGRAEMRMSPLWGCLCNNCYNDKSQKSFVKYVKCWHWHKEEENHEMFFYKTEEDYDMNPTRYFGVELETLSPAYNVTVRAGEMAEMINRLGERTPYTPRQTVH